MVTGRRWPRDRFEALLVRHPLLTHMSRRLVWGVYAAGDTLTATFRVTEELDWADAKDQPFALGQAEHIGIVHPAHLSPADAAAWGEIFSEYEIIPPFQQLGRAIYKLEPGEEAKTDLNRFNHVTLRAMIFVAILNRQGWTRGLPRGADDSGSNWNFGGHHMPFPGAGITAVVESEPVQSQTADDFRIRRAYFLAGVPSADGCLDPQTQLKLGDVHPVVLSETIRYLHALQAAAK
jgi:hypothetical protein